MVNQTDDTGIGVSDPYMELQRLLLKIKGEFLARIGMRREYSCNRKSKNVMSRMAMANAMKDFLSEEDFGDWWQIDRTAVYHYKKVHRANLRTYTHYRYFFLVACGLCDKYKQELYAVAKPSRTSSVARMSKVIEDLDIHEVERELWFVNRKIKEYANRRVEIEMRLNAMREERRLSIRNGI
jgi:hypothetical protein